ncbi:hypothetical protein BH11VER1_BH11VER1_10120 [soil metagenome]
MKTTTSASATKGSATQPGASRSLIPLWLKISYTAFLAVLIPVYWINYGPTNFLYFCDFALFLTLFAVWKENRLAASMAAVGILLPQFFWCVDFGLQLVRMMLGLEHSGMTAYMFDENKSLFLRGLSFFHGWLPFLLMFLVLRLGYDRFALKAYTVLAWALCLIAYFFLPPAGANLPNPNTPVNVDYVFGLNDAQPQQWMPQGVYLVVWMLALFSLAYLPTHLLLNKFVNRRNAE